MRAPFALKSGVAFAMAAGMAPFALPGGAGVFAFIGLGALSVVMLISRDAEPL
ncbi:MAG: hypothetical protein QM651_16935 [Rhodoblastus sp.]